MIVGLTGNMGCGKTTVTKILRTYNDVEVFDCDSHAKGILLKDRETVSEIVGCDLTRSDEKSLYASVAYIIFKDAEKKAALEELIHPRVFSRMDEFYARTKSKLFIVECATIFEHGYHDKFDHVLVVACPPDLQFRRLNSDRGMSSTDIEARRKHQMSQEAKVSMADSLIYTDCAPYILNRQIELWYKSLLEVAS